MSKNPPNYISTTNACKLCTPLGAALAFKGIEGAVPYLHGSQGCATYMRRYIISHFNEPIDIASSSLSEKHAVYGGGANLKLGLMNVTEKYRPQLIGIATTCLTETIGDDVKLFLREYDKEVEGEKPIMVQVSTPSYSGTHMEGFHNAIASVVEALAGRDGKQDIGSGVNILPGFVSPADIRYLKEITDDFSMKATILPDISDTMDGPAAKTYAKIQPGGTPLSAIAVMGNSMGSVEFGHTMAEASGGVLLAEKFGVENTRMAMPMGIGASDRFFAYLSRLSGVPVPEKHQAERGRLVDSYVDSHKYVYGKKAIVYGEEDLVVGLTTFLAEIGVMPVLCASGGKSGKLAERIRQATADLLPEQPQVHEAMDFYDISELAESLGPDLLVGHSKGYPLAQKLSIPLIRVGFPIHDRMGGQRILHLGYRGTQQLFDLVVNACIAKKQGDSPIGYSYM
ncbi:MAG: nitrogenase [Proteobacteria bacterium]|nr:nitrogenase [Pseudomonadota bacterium]MBU1060068.1 nitrogenase [Pseudomonadota bacterium]